MLKGPRSSHPPTECSNGVLLQLVLEILGIKLSFFIIIGEWICNRKQKAKLSDMSYSNTLYPEFPLGHPLSYTKAVVNTIIKGVRK